VIGVSYGGIQGLKVVANVHVCLVVAPGVYEVEAKFGMEKLGAVCVYPCSNMLNVVCCGIPKVGVEPSMMVQL
jgi:hypothetical protein